MAFKMRGYPKQATAKYASALKQVEPRAVEGGGEVVGGPEVGEGGDNEVTRDEFVDWFYQNPPKGWDGADIEEEPFEWAIDQVNEENPDMTEIEKMPLIIQLLEQGEDEQPIEETEL